MISVMKEKYEELKKHRNQLLNYDEILLFYPDYYKTKIELERKQILSKEQAAQYFEENYKNSDLYKKLVALNMAEDEIYVAMKQNMLVKYASLKSIYEKGIQCSIILCELIDYVGHYPTTYPVPTKDEKNEQLEQLLEKYDIIVRYHLGDVDFMQITADDIVRIIDKLEENLDFLRSSKIWFAGDYEWMFTRKTSGEEIIKFTEEAIESIEQFPLSFAQMNGKSHIEEGKSYIRLQHGENQLKYSL